MADAPQLTVTTTKDWPLVGFLHSGMKVRTIFAETIDALRRRVTSSLIAEFGMGQEDARAHAGTLAADHAEPAAQIAALKAELADLAAKLAGAESHVWLLQEELTDAQAEIERMNTPAEPPQTNAPPTETVTTEAESGPKSQTPPAADASSLAGAA